MKYCEWCRQVEGETREGEGGVIECAECGEEVHQVPEHDDYDMER